MESSKADETVTISKDRYEELIRSELWLGCLEAAGIDNTEAYAEASRYFHGEEEEEDDN